jgi:hypothetical protein
LTLAIIFYCLRFETSLFVASYDSQGHGGGIRPRLHTGTPSNDLPCPFITPRHRSCRKHKLSVVEKTSLLIRCLAMEVLLLRLYASTGLWLPNRRLAMGQYATVVSVGYLMTHYTAWDSGMTDELKMTRKEAVVA